MAKSRRTFQFSLLGIMGFVAISAIGFAGLRQPSLFWANIHQTIAFCGLVICSLLGIVSKGQSRVFALGCAIGGWSYLIAISDGLLPNIGTKQLERILYAKMQEDATLGNPTFEDRFWESQNRSYFAAIWDSLWTWIFALISGQLAGYIRGKNKKSDE